MSFKDLEAEIQRWLDTEQEARDKLAALRTVSVSQN